MKKKLPRLKTDKEAEEFVATADLTEYDLSIMRPAQFEFHPKDKRGTRCLLESLYEALKDKAARAGVPYQRFIRQVPEAAMQHP